MTASWSVYYSIFCKCRRCLTGRLCQWNRDFYKCKNAEKAGGRHKEKLIISKDANVVNVKWGEAVLQTRWAEKEKKGGMKISIFMPRLKNYASARMSRRSTSGRA